MSSRSYPALPPNAHTSSGKGCPVCAGPTVLPEFNDLAMICPRLADDWHPTANGGLRPSMVSTGSTRRA